MTTKPFAPIAAAAILILTGCGTTAPAADAPTTSTPGDSAVTFEVPGGDEVTLPDGPAERVVALEWGQA